VAPEIVDGLWNWRDGGCLCGASGLANRECSSQGGWHASDHLIALPHRRGENQVSVRCHVVRQRPSAMLGTVSAERTCNLLGELTHRCSDDGVRSCTLNENQTGHLVAEVPLRPHLK
jgi:hypothetical protein